MSWASRRRGTYLSILIVVAIVVVGFISFQVFYETPTCSDGVQNGNEGGIDCGGACERVCSFQAVDPIVLWSRFFEVAPGIYNAVALIENPNINTIAKDVGYTFKLHDSAGILVYERKGETNILNTSQFVVFQSGIVTGERAPQRIFFEFIEVPEWNKTSAEGLNVRTKDINLTNEETEPRLTAQLLNESFDSISNVEVVAVLFGEDGNASASSRTTIDFLQGRAEENIIFTWPTPFSEPVARIELFPQLLGSE